MKYVLVWQESRKEKTGCSTKSSITFIVLFIALPIALDTPLLYSASTSNNIMKGAPFSIIAIVSSLFLDAAAFTLTPNEVAIRSSSSSGSALASTTEGVTESNQSKYGKELALPDTYVRCGRCATSFALTVNDLGEGKGR